LATAAWAVAGAVVVGGAHCREREEMEAAVAAVEAAKRAEREAAIAAAEVAEAAELEEKDRGADAMDVDVVVLDN
jgi:hypothetical protein